MSHDRARVPEPRSITLQAPLLSRDCSHGADTWTRESLESASVLRWPARKATAAKMREIRADVLKIIYHDEVKNTLVPNYFLHGGLLRIAMYISKAYETVDSAPEGKTNDIFEPCPAAACVLTFSLSLRIL